MARTEASAIIDRPIADVWKFMTDISNTPKWDPGVLEVRLTSASPPRLGTTL
jgi:uncharacterized protein YndB with AHSA1/START domain